MAAEIPYSIIAEILLQLGEEAVRRVVAACGVAKQLDELHRKLGIINGFLLDAEEKRVESSEVRAWLATVKDVAYNVDDLLDQFLIHQLHRGGGFFSSTNKFVFSYKMAEKVKKIRKEAYGIVEQIPRMLKSMPKGEPGSTGNSRETQSYVNTPEVVGREKEKEEMMMRLLSFSDQQILSGVAIVGIGGLGKTTLAQFVYNDPVVSECFHLKIWVHVSDKFDVKLLVKNMLQSLSKGDVVECLRLEDLTARLHRHLTGKRCLIVLDDVWNDDVGKWEELVNLLMVVGKGSKIVVTTRNDSRVAYMRGLSSPVMLKGLDAHQSWDLFAKIAFSPKGRDQVAPRFLEIGKEMANMCQGVPLLIKTLATVSRSRTSESEWLSLRNSKNFLSVGGRDHESALSVLKVSYDKLPPYLKQCFAYCALFPKDHNIERRKMVQMWMAQGYIQPLNEDTGDRYFEELLSRSLLEVSERGSCNGGVLSCKMHDLIRELALSVVGRDGRDDFLILEDGHVQGIPILVRHVSMLLKSDQNLKWKASKVKQVRTFMSFSIDNYGYQDDLVRRIDSLDFKRLRVLTINGCKKNRLGISLGKLRHLRYLDLSYSDFEKLPKSITELRSLQTLRVVGCGHLKRLRKETRKMVSLRHLENDGCFRLSEMPCGIGELTTLRGISVFVVGKINGNKNGKKVGRLSELKWLNELRGELSIVNLENVNERGWWAAAAESKEANLSAKQHLKLLRLEWGRDGNEAEADAHVLEGLVPPPSLEGLCIKGYGGRKFPDGLIIGLPCLAAVKLEGCSRCRTLPCFDTLRFLKSLELLDLKEVEYMIPADRYNYYCSFPSLEKLSLHGMDKLKGLWRIDFLSAYQPPSFPLLSQIKLTQCPLLASLPLPPTPRLTQLEIRNCDQLASVEFHSCPTLSQLQICQCSQLTSLQLPASPRLSHLEIRTCHSLASIRLSSSPILSDLHFSVCLQLKSLILPPTPNLSTLKIFGCLQLAYVQVYPFPSLKRLELDGLREEVRRQLMRLNPQQ